MVGQDDQLKLIDFGLSVDENTNTIGDITGTPYYLSPEMAEGKDKITGKCDVWALGIMLYAMLTNEFPFDGNNLQDMMTTIKKGVFAMPSHLSPNCKDLLKKMLKTSAFMRISASEIIKHPWIVKNRCEVLRKPILTLSEKQMKYNALKFKKFSLMKQMSIRQLVRMLNSSNFEDLRHQYFLHNIKDTTYIQFLCENMNHEAFLTDVKIKAIFKSLDVESQDRITMLNVKVAQTKFGLDVKWDTMATMFKEHGKDGSS